MHDNVLETYPAHNKGVATDRFIKTHSEWKSVIADRFIRNLKKISDHITIKLKSSNVTSGKFFDYGVEEDFVVKKVKPTVMWTYSITDAND